MINKQNDSLSLIFMIIFLSMFIASKFYENKKTYFLKYLR